VDEVAALQEIRGVLENELGIPAEKITLSANMRDDLEMDSLDLMEMATILEDRFGGGIDKDDIEQVRTIGDVVVVVASLSAIGTTAQ
jgi:acyl carrier protein